MNDSLLDHFESFLGPITAGWSTDATGKRLPFQIISFENDTVPGTGVLSTLGLSNVPLRIESKNGANRLRQELIAMYRLSEGPRNLPGILQELGMEAIQRDQAYALGDVIGPRGELSPGATVSAFYVALPVYLVDSFHVCRTTTEPVVIAWMVSITDKEAAFIRAQGRDAFESLLESSDPDLLDTSRNSIV